VARQRVRLRVLGESANLLERVRNCDGVISASAGASGWLAVDHAEDERFVADLVRTLVLSGAEIIGVEPERAELERIFLEVTKGRGA
jgi:ABC-2 type transport system ATP-binding protein